MAKKIKIDVTFTAWATIVIDESCFEEWANKNGWTYLEMDEDDRAEAIEEFTHDTASIGVYYGDYSGKHSYVCVTSDESATIHHDAGDSEFTEIKEREPDGDD
jgi:hypothetical protein